MRHASRRRLSAPLVLLLAGCKQERPAPAQRTASTPAGRPAVASPAGAARYDAVRIDGEALPYRFENPDTGGASCTVTIRSATYEIAGGRWRHTQDGSSTCAPIGGAVSDADVSADSGRFVRAGDTLVTFQAWNAYAKRWATAQEGVWRGDTLRVGAPLYDGPPEVYVRRPR